MNKKKETDICYLYEEIPFLGRTGDSVFIRQLAKDFPEYRFSVVKITNRESPNPPADEGGVGNIDGYEAIDLSHHGSQGKGKTSVTFRRAGDFFHSVARAVDSGKLGGDTMNDLFDCAADLAPQITFAGVWKNQTTWELIKAVYAASSGDIPFVEHRELLQQVIRPVWRLLSKWPDLPQARIYHADSGMLSGLLALVTARKVGAKCILVDDCLPLNALERERQGTKLREGGVWRPDFEGVQSARTRWIRLLRVHCLSQADEVLANTVSAANRIRAELGEERTIRVVREGIEGETARRWAAYYRKEEEEVTYRVVFLIGAFGESLSKGLISTMRSIEAAAGGGKFVILSLSSLPAEDRKRFLGDAKLGGVTSSVRFADESNMIQEIARASVVAFPSQLDVGDRPVINSLHAGKPVVVSMIDGNSVFASHQFTAVTDCFLNPSRFGGNEFATALISLIRRRGEFDFHPRRLGEALFNHQEILEGYGKVYHSLRSVA